MAEQAEYLYSSRPVSSRYEAYEKRIRKINSVLKWFWSHKVIMIVSVAAVMAIVLGFLSIKGTFIGTFSCDDHVYGEKAKVSCVALFSRPRYEFAHAAEEATWNDDMPVMPGQYCVRAYTKDGFGNLNYTETLTFTIHLRELDMEVESCDYTYGDMSLDFVAAKTKITGLAEGDSVVDVEYGIQKDEGYNYSAGISAFRVVNSNGADVTDCYEIDTFDGAFTMVPRKVTIKALDETKVYDAQEWNGGSIELLDSTLAQGDSLFSNFSPLPADVGSYDIVPELQILGANGEDMGSCYDIAVVNGTLVVEPKEIVLKTESARKTYDEKPLTNPSWSIVSGETVPGHSLYVEVIGSQEVVGVSANNLLAVVTNDKKEDVSRNYSILTQEGSLTIDPIVLKVRSESAEKVYDGQVLSAGGELVEGSVLKGHKLSIGKQYEVVNVGTYQNIPEVIVTNKKGQDVTKDGYKIEIDYGKLVITPRPITVTSKSAEKLYDGYPLICHEYSLTSGTLGKQGGYEAISSAIFPASQTSVGSCTNTFTVFIYSNSGFETTGNYLITYEYGTLTVLENPNHKDPDEGGFDDSFGEPTGIGFPDKGENGGGPIAYITGLYGLDTSTPIYLRTQSYGDYNTVGWMGSNPWKYNNTYNSTLTEIGRALDNLGNPRAGIHIKRDIGCSVIMPYFTSNGNLVYDEGNDCYYASCPKEFEVEYHAGLSYDDILDLQPIPTDPALEKLYRQFVYDEYLQVPASTSHALLQWAARNGISADSPTLVQDIQLAVRNAAMYNMEAEDYPVGVDVVVYFLTEAREGICQHFASAATLLYRCFGIPARYTVGYLTSVRNGVVTELVSDNAHAWTEIYLDGIGWVPIDATPGSGSGSGGGGGDLTITGYSAVKYYDGKPFDLSDIQAFTVEKGFIRRGHRLEVTFKSISKYIEPGEYKLEIKKYVIYDKDGNDVTDQYDEIELKPGTLTILKRKITITTGSASKVYDGLPLTCLTYWISQGSLAPGDELMLELPSVITEPGIVENIIEKLKIVNYNSKRPKNVTDFYEINIITGYLEITAAP